ncbi:MAG: 4Fe-4S binding protein, partial [Spirochaetota bacterium]
DVARAAVRTNASKVDMFCLESRKEMPALEEEIEEALDEKITINNSWGPKRIIVENGKVVGVEFKKCISVFDEGGKFSPKFNESDIMTVEADSVLISVGQSIEWGSILDGKKVELNRNNTAAADPFTYQTRESDIFVGGDAYTGPKFAIDAIAAGKQGAISIHRYVWEGQSLVIGRDRRDYHALDKQNIVVEGYDTARRQKAGHIRENKKSFKDNRVTFTEAQMKKETERCLSCGAVAVDQEMCIGCGQCTTKCKFDAIKLTKKFDARGSTFEKLPLHMGVHIANRMVKIAARSVKDIVSS